MPQPYEDWKRDEILRDLRSLRDGMLELEEMMKGYRVRRDKLVLRAIERGISENTIVRNSDITRGWIWQLKNGKTKKPRKGRRRVRVHVTDSPGPGLHSGGDSG